MWSAGILGALRPSRHRVRHRYGGSAVYFANIMRQISSHSEYLPWTTHTKPSIRARREPDILFVESSSTERRLPNKFNASNEYPGKIFAILDSDHSMNHVLAR